MPKYQLTESSSHWVIDGVKYIPGDVIELSKESFEQFQTEKNGIDLREFKEMKEDKKETKQ